MFLFLFICKIGKNVSLLNRIINTRILCKKVEFRTNIVGIALLSPETELPWEFELA